MKYKDIKVGMKLRLKTQNIDGHINYTHHDYKIGDIVEVINKDGDDFEIRKIRDKDEFYCIPKIISNEDEYAEYWEPVNKSMKELLE